MAVPTAQTANLIVNEAYKKVGIASPDTAAQNRAEVYFLEEVTQDIANRRDSFNQPIRLKSLQAESVDICVDGQSKYSFPSDYEEEITITLLSGTHTGTAQTGTTVTITLEDEEDAATTDVEGHYILCTGGTGENNFRQCIDYADSSYVATVDVAWDTTPDSTTTYVVVDSIKDLNPDHEKSVGPLGSSMFSRGMPSGYIKKVDDENDYFVLDKPPDDEYGLLIRYYVDIMKVDLTGNLIAKLYRKWRNALVYGVAWKIAEDEDDDKYAALKAEYEKVVANLLVMEQPYTDEFEGFEL